MHVTPPFEQPNEIKNPDRDERAAGQPWEYSADPTVNRHSAPDDEHTKRGREQSMSRAGEPCDCQRLGLVPPLGARRDYEGQPMSWNYGMEKPDGKAAANRSEEHTSELQS